MPEKSEKATLGALSAPHEPPTSDPDPEPTPAPTVETTDAPAEEESGRADVKVKLNPDFEPAQEDGEAVISVGGYDDLTVTDKPETVEGDHAELLLTSPAVVAVED